MTLSSKASAFVSSFDGAIDEFCTTGRKFDVAQLISQSKMKPAEMKEVQEKFAKKVEELELVVIDADEQLMEGYSNLTKQQQRDMLIAYHTIMEVKSEGKRMRKAKSIDTDGVIRVPSVKQQTEKIVENFSAVYATCPKYFVIRTFKGNVKAVSGKNVTADEIYETKFPKDVDLSVISSMTQDQIEDFVSTGTRHSHVPHSYTGKAVDVMVSFA
jgi:hypothetical protein